ncbi:RNase H domain-containing protein [Trichonephila clavipes]|nr:RNase H domain-containing protein [Trichonephila clavipes]
MRNLPFRRTQRPKSNKVPSLQNQSGPPEALTGESTKQPSVFKAVREIHRSIFGVNNFGKVDRFRSEIQLAGRPTDHLIETSAHAPQGQMVTWIKEYRKTGIVNCLPDAQRNAINIVQFSDKSTEDFPVICYTDGSKIDGRVGFAFVVFRCGVESENFQFRIRDECTVFVAELLCLNFAVKWIPEQNRVILEHLICTDSLSSLDSLKCISSSNNIIVEIQKQLKSLRDKNISIHFAFVRGHTGVLGNERADWLAKAATKRKIDIDANIPKSFYKKIANERVMKSWNQEYLISNKGSITKKFFPTINKRLSCYHFYTI